MRSRDGKLIVACVMTDDTLRYGNCATCCHARDWQNCHSLNEGDPGFCDHGERFRKGDKMNYIVEIRGWKAGSGYSFNTEVDTLDTYCTAEQYIESLDAPYNNEYSDCDDIEVAILGEKHEELSTAWESEVLGDSEEEKEMKKFEVMYTGGESRYSDKGVDYMLADVDGTELYAEAAPILGDVTGTYNDLKAAIILQAKEAGINPDSLHFFYDGCPEDEDSYIVCNSYGIRVSFDYAVSLMDDDLREELHSELAPCTDQEFFDAYAEAHLDRFGEEWEPAKKNPVF